MHSTETSEVLKHDRSYKKINGTIWIQPKHLKYWNDLKTVLSLIGMNSTETSEVLKPALI